MRRIAEPSLADSFGLPFSSLVSAVDINNKLQSPIMLVFILHVGHEGGDDTRVIGQVSFQTLLKHLLYREL